MIVLCRNISNLLITFIAFLVIGCNSPEQSEPYAVQQGAPSYSLAQGCYALKAIDDHRYMVSNGRTVYRFTSVDISDAERFFLKPTGLGTFMLYDHEGGYLGNGTNVVNRQWEANSTAEWRINDILDGNNPVEPSKILVATATNMRLLLENSMPAVATNQGPIQSAALFSFVPLAKEACKPFPEANLDAEVSPDFYTPKDPSQPVVGFADLHNHISFPKAIGGLAMSGSGFSPWGIEKALGSCSQLHGKNGSLDLLESQQISGGASGHATDGYPTFSYWPNRSTLTHVETYYRWIQRTYLSGMRIMVNHVTGNPSFCQLLSAMHWGMLEGDCKSDADVLMQVRYIYDMQDYIDAQEGGPGKGWFRVVTSPQQARQVISQNKLAVVLGSEYGTLFDCTESATGCTADYVDTKLDQLYALGVRSIFPIHRFDNAFGGTQPAGGSSGAWMNFTSMLSTGNVQNITDLLLPKKLLFKPITGHFWQLEQCPDGVPGEGGMKSMKQFMDEDFGFIKKDIASIPVFGGVASNFVDYAIFNKLKPLPEYTEFSHGGNGCNVRPLQEVGRHLINRIVDKGMILEIDHMSYNTRIATLEILENRHYSGFISSHGWIENMESMRDRIFKLGGMMAPFNDTPSKIASTINLYSKEMQSYPYLIGIGIGSDVQGVTSQPTGDSHFTISYPFKSVDGLVTFTQPKTGDRAFDFNSEGVAHYGVYAEWLENFRQVAQQRNGEAMKIFMNSAEAYLQMWERADSQAKERGAAVNGKVN